MTAVYATILFLGVLGLLSWVAATGVARSVDGWHGVDPESRFGPMARSVLAAFLGFGMGGMSAAFAGWSSIFAFAAALVGAGALVAVAVWLGPPHAQDDASRR